MDETIKTIKGKGPDIGLHQAKRLCQLPEQDRLAFIAEGLPIILDSAQGFWKASQQLTEKMENSAGASCGLLIQVGTGGFYPARADTSEKAHLGPGGVSWKSEGSIARNLSVRRSG